MRTSRTAFRALVSLGMVVVLGRCSDSEETHLEQDELLTIVASPALSDTVTAKPVQALVVALRTESGAPNQDAIIQFATFVDDGVLANMVIRPLDGSGGSYQVAVHADDRGQAAVQVQFGPVAGPGRIHVIVPELGISMTMEFAVQAGNLASIIATPEDSTVTVGTTPRISAAAVDRFNNPRPDPIAFLVESSPANAATIGDNGVVTANAPGLLRIIASTGAVKDTATLSVVPDLSYVAINDAEGLVLRRLDGTDKRVLGPANTFSEIDPAWTPDGSNVAIAAVQFDRRIDFVAEDGQTTTLSWPAPASNALWPAISQDGAYVYYTAVATFGISGLARIKRDGSSGPEKVISPCVCIRPTVSPSQRYVAYHAPTGNEVQVWVYDRETEQHVGLPVPGVFPEWSPDGSRIAYIETETDRIRLMQPGGPPGPYLASADRTFAGQQLSWSRDSRWILAKQGRLSLIEVATGMVLPLAGTFSDNSAALRP